MEGSKIGGSAEKAKSSGGTNSGNIPLAAMSNPGVRSEPSLLPLIKKLSEADAEVKKEAGAIEVSASTNAARQERTGKLRKRLQLFGCMLIGGVLGNVLGSGVIDQKNVSEAATNTWSFVAEASTRLIGSKIGERAQIARSDEGLKLAIPTELPNQELADLRSSTERLRADVHALKSDFGGQIIELKRNNTRLQEDVTRLSDDIKLRALSLADSAPETSKVIDTSGGDSRKNVSPPAIRNQRPAASSPRTNTRVASASAPTVSSSASSQEAIALEQYTLRRVVNGVAVMQDRTNSFEVRVGDDIPGVGPVQAITQQGNRWVVQTAKGSITTR